MSENVLKRILIVEDDPDVAELLATFFERAGLAATVAYGVRDAAILLENAEAFSVVLADVHIGQGSGFEIIGRLKGSARPTPVYLVTGDPEISEKDALAAGAAGIFHKPFEFSELVQTILRAAAQSGAQAPTDPHSDRLAPRH